MTFFRKGKSPYRSGCPYHSSLKNFVERHLFEDYPFELNSSRRTHVILPQLYCRPCWMQHRAGGGGDSCSALVTKCGISAADFSKYKPGPNLCSTLVPGQPVCCSAGTLLGFAPKPKPDRSCATYTIRQDDNCANLAAQYSLTKEDRGLQQEDMGLEWLLKCLGRDSNLSK